MSKTYIHREDAHNLIAPQVVVPLIMKMIKPSSVLDIGCGIGTWLKIFEGNGISDYLGVDAEYVDRSLLKISEKNFYSHDLTKILNLNKRFDLVISLEVAEHLDSSLNNQFVKMLCAHGDVILFSAAIPGQGGQHHINERWLSDWIPLFNELGYVFYDALRPLIWNNQLVDVWYKQNAVFFCRKGHVLEKVLEKISSPYLDIVHPDLFSFYSRQAQRALLLEEGKLGIQLAWNSLVNALINKIK